MVLKRLVRLAEAPFQELKRRIVSVLDQEEQEPVLQAQRERAPSLSF